MTQLHLRRPTDRLKIRSEPELKQTAGVEHAFACRVFTGLVAELVQVAQRVSTEKDYSVRAKQHGQGEPAMLVNIFNRILAKIQRRDVALQEVRAELERRVTERTRELKFASIEREAAMEELRAALQDVGMARDEAQAANEAKSEFLANMSHEIRTPMTAILGFSDVLLEAGEAGVSAAEKAEAARTIKRNGEYLLSIVNDILDISKIEAGKLELERMECSAAKIVTEVEALMQVRAEAKGLELGVEWNWPLPERIRTDPTRIKQILVNLLGNAIKFTETGSVRLVTSFLRPADGPALMQFDVIDTGIGLTEEQAIRLFQPFVQADNSTTRRFGGSGLGLVISRRLADMLGGSVTLVRTEPGAGSHFRMAIDAGVDDGVSLIEKLPDDAAKLKSARRPLREEPAPKLNCRVLLAEDGPDNQRLISHIVRKAGAEITIVNNGQVAVAKALAAVEAGEAFDVILMDMQMPVLDGYRATAQLREQGYARPIIALTAHAMSHDREKCISAGCDDYAPKPINKNGLIALIQKYVALNGPDSQGEQPPSAAPSGETDTSAGAPNPAGTHHEQGGI